MLTRGSSSGPFWNKEASLSLSKIQMVEAATQDKTVVSDGAWIYWCNHTTKVDIGPLIWITEAGQPAIKLVLTERYIKV